MTTTSPISLETCQAVMIGLGLRLFVIVRRDDPAELRPFDRQRQRLRDLQPGDEVFYKGGRHVVRSVEVYE